MFAGVGYGRPPSLFLGEERVLKFFGVVAFGASMIVAPVSVHSPVLGGFLQQCIPVDAWTETVPEVPAVGEPTIIVDNPDYRPETTETVFDHWQRYSYNGAWESNEEAPPFPGDNWQANTASDPHGIGEEGAYFRSKGGSGKGDWFYLEAVMKSVTIPAVGDPTIEVENPDYVPPVPERKVEHPAVECPVDEVPVDEVPEVSEEPVDETPVDEEPVVVVPETPSLPDVPVIEVPSAPVAPVAVETGRP